MKYVLPCEMVLKLLFIELKLQQIYHYNYTLRLNLNETHLKYFGNLSVKPIMPQT